MKILECSDLETRCYGNVITKNEFSNEDRNKIIEWMSIQTQIPEKGDIYVADLTGFEVLDLNEKFKTLTGVSDLQFGYCHGHNKKVNALEWHNGTEVILAITECVLFLGLQSDMFINKDQLIYDTKDLIALKLKKGEIIVLFDQVLHYAPVQIDDSGFMTMIILPKNTNEQLVEKSELPTRESESIVSRYLFLKNKWLIAHEESVDLLVAGAQLGLVGENFDWSDIIA